MLGWVMLERMPYRKIIGVLLLTLYPVGATILLTGGGFGTSTTSVGVYTILGLAAITCGRLGKAGWLKGVLADVAMVVGRFAGGSGRGFQPHVN